MTPEQVAQQSAALLENEAFRHAMEEVRRTQVNVFTDPRATPDAIATAHNMIAALYALEAQLRRGVTDAKFTKRAARKGQHRDND